MIAKAKAEYALVLVVMLLAVLPACTAVPAETSMKLQSSSAVKVEPSATELINGYRRWTRVNPVPALFHASTAALCAPVSATPSELEKSSPHRDKFITVYVNELGTKAMMHERNPHFPQGSVIVKEKLPTKNSSSPELLTVMIKRETGFNPDNGDWEYVALDGTGKDVQARGRLENCQTCHTMVKNTDFVYRSYLPPKVWETLK